MKETDAVDWHTNFAATFDAGYKCKADFIERLEVWTGLIDRYSNADFQVLDIGCGSGVFSVLCGRKKCRRNRG